MAPLPSLVNNNTLSPRKYEVDMEKEMFISTLILGFIAASCAIFLGITLYLKLKPKYEEEWKPKLKPKLRDCKEKYEDWKEKIGTWHGPKGLKAPAPAHVARSRASEAPDVNQITCDLTPDYLKMSTAIIV
ncbi:hypothetical protein PEX1_096460 [Penicillium expansum]|uniref:Uncharacterized protein n=1 Tax=Penicillium expansum TaxID=27334 RepID=A0A0A2JKW7_PENEN|nr:hypothetical protein PEX2_003450 [Penicillium expansum]KGO42870.1 hypothetical protein PEXP_026190 [Penicillium expansum]KGO56019.1 hypothetical protein PEX1_096460 [Penicillium expansum]KGO56991.1 hypothetical protein PEX2_003450 [Penicillium expansum]